jgi:hypothetical protein
MVQLLKEMAEVMYKIQGSSDPELELMPETLKVVSNRPKLYGWQDKELLEAIGPMLGEIRKLYSPQEDNVEPTGES